AMHQPEHRHAGTVGVMAASAPGIVLAGVAVFWLMHRQQRAAMV
ncbi:hypothetical protein, partial [Klebsiella pneumoniae]